MFQPSSRVSGFLKSSESDENMSSKKYEANIGTTRHASASQHAHLLSLKVFFRVVMLFLDVRQFETVSLLLVLYLEEERHDECKYSE